MGVCALAVWLIYLLTSRLTHAPTDIQSAIIPTVGVVLGWIIGHYFTKRRQTAARHYDDKRRLYNAYADIIFHLLSEEMLKERNAKPSKNLTVEMVNFKKLLTIWGGADTIKLWNELEACASDDGMDHLMLHEQFLRAIRKDLGHNDGALGEGELLKLTAGATERSNLEQQIEEYLARK